MHNKDDCYVCVLENTIRSLNQKIEELEATQCDPDNCVLSRLEDDECLEWKPYQIIEREG